MIQTGFLPCRCVEVKGLLLSMLSDFKWAAIVQSVQRLATGWTVWESNRGGGEIFRTRPDWFWGPHSLLYVG